MKNSNSKGTIITEHSKGDHLEAFIMSCDKDKIEQLLRESHKDRPKAEVDLNLISTEALSEDKMRKKEEDKRKIDDERIKKSKHMNKKLCRNPLLSNKK